MSQPPPPPEPPPPPPARPSPHRSPQDEEEEEEEEEGGGGALGSPPGPVYRLGSRRCRRCLITFPDAAFAARHAKRQHPRDFAAAALRGALFVCFVCARPFGSSPALLRHQRGHAHAPPTSGGKAAPASCAKATPLPGFVAQTSGANAGPLPVLSTPTSGVKATPPHGFSTPTSGVKATPPPGFPTPTSGVKATPPPVLTTPTSGVQTTPFQAATPPLACTECGRAFAREGALHRHYIRHARGEL